MTVYAKSGEELYIVDCPAFRLKKNVYVYAHEKERDLVFWMSPVYGIEWNVMICRPNDDIIGVLQNLKRFGPGDEKGWLLVDANGKERLRIKSELSNWQRLKRWFTIFSFHRHQILMGDQVVAVFEKHSGLIQGHYEVDIMPNAVSRDEQDMVLAACIALTGVFRIVFTRFS